MKYVLNLYDQIKCNFELGEMYDICKKRYHNL